jgi:copper chaperone for superoxide dismutase
MGMKFCSDEIPGIHKVSGDLKNQLISIEGNASPSAIVQAIQDTGRDAILRGSGKPNSKLSRVPLQCQ